MNIYMKMKMKMFIMNMKYELPKEVMAYLCTRPCIIDMNMDILPKELQ